MEQVEAERRAALEATKFKAREFKPVEMRAASVGGGSGKTTPSAALMAVVKGFQLHSLIRSQQREEFEAKIREREEEKQQAEIARLEDIKRQEEEEIQRLRKQMVFRASKIKKYRLVVPETAFEQRPLTVPLPPKLYTAERATLKDDLMDGPK